MVFIGEYLQRYWMIVKFNDTYSVLRCIFYLRILGLSDIIKIACYLENMECDEDKAFKLIWCHKGDNKIHIHMKKYLIEIK